MAHTGSKPIMLYSVVGSARTAVVLYHMNVALHGKTVGHLPRILSATQNVLLYKRRVGWGMHHSTGMYRREGRCYCDCCHMRVTGCPCRALQRRCGASQSCAIVMEVEATRWIAVSRRRSVMGSGMRQVGSPGTRAIVGRKGTAICPTYKIDRRMY